MCHEKQHKTIASANKYAHTELPNGFSERFDVYLDVGDAGDLLFDSLLELV
jgi:hypothetical protein